MPNMLALRAANFPPPAAQVIMPRPTSTTRPVMNEPLTSAQRAKWIGLITVVCVALDQLSKVIAKSYLNLTDVHSFLGDTVRFTLAHNRGAFLSLGASLPESIRQPLFSVGVGVLLIALLVYALRSKTLDRLAVTALALVFAGGASNLGDRVVYGGYVVDYVQLGIGWLRTGVFNIADMAIMAGAFILLFDAFRKDRKPK
jgi:signal peptidase II